MLVLKHNLRRSRTVVLELAVAVAVVLVLAAGVGRLVAVGSVAVGVEPVVEVVHMLGDD